MIISVTMNPSVDISYPLENFKLDTVNRVTNTTKTAGGKGLNVARVLQQAGANVLASGMIGGHLGEFIQSELENNKISHDFFLQLMVKRVIVLRYCMKENKRKF